MLFRSTSEDSRFLFLLLSMVGFTVLQAMGPHLYLLDVGLVVVLVSTILAIASHHKTVITAIVLIVAFWASTLVRVFLIPPESVWLVRIFILDDLLVGAFSAFMAMTILGDVFRAEEITTDKIYGAICSYVLIGLGWAALYSAIATSDPLAFNLPASDVVAEGARRSWIYYSFVTLTTLGYGDITPVNTLARTLSWMEAAFGQIYLAVLIAKLVSELRGRRNTA